MTVQRIHWRKSLSSEPSGNSCRGEAAPNNTTGVRASKEDPPRRPGVHAPRLEQATQPDQGSSRVTMQRFRWRKSRHSGPDRCCVEVARTSDDTIGIRDSKGHPDRIILVNRAEWATLLTTIKAGASNSG